MKLNRGKESMKNSMRERTIGADVRMNRKTAR